MSKDKTWGELSNKKRRKIIEANEAGIFLEVNSWSEGDTYDLIPGKIVRFSDHFSYRIPAKIKKRMKKQKKNKVIPWDFIPTDYSYIAKDVNGTVWLFVDQPYMNGPCWVANSSEYIQIFTDSLADVPFRKSLMKRPE